MKICIIDFVSKMHAFALTYAQTVHPRIEVLLIERVLALTMRVIRGGYEAVYEPGLFSNKACGEGGCND